MICLSARRTAAQLGGAGDGSGVFCGRVAGKIVEAGGVGQSRVEGRQTVLLGAGVSLLCAGRWPAGVARAGALLATAAGVVSFGPATLALSLPLNRGKS